MKSMDELFAEEEAAGISKAKAELANPILQEKERLERMKSYIKTQEYFARRRAECPCTECGGKSFDDEESVCEHCDNTGVEPDPEDKDEGDE